MSTLRFRMRTSIYALILAAFAASILAPFMPATSVAAEQIDVMATEQVYVRSGASTDDAIIGELFKGDWVTTTGYEENGFVEIWYGDWVGYVYADYLDYTPATTTTETAADEQDNTTTVETGWLYTNDSVNLRVGPGTGEGVVTVLPAGTSLYRTGNVSNGFAEVESDLGNGWVHADYLSWDAPAVAAPVAEAKEESTNGDRMVGFAMQYLGYPYVWAGNTPSGFDCSGFTQYVTQNVLGYDITHSTDIQATFGTPVAWGDWQAGDLVFFVGTGGSGYISHVGIYIGDGQFIHAENPGTGVVISSIYSSYYSTHYYSATRLD